MKPLGRKHTKSSAGHQNCAVCHPKTKAGRALEKVAVQTEIESPKFSKFELSTVEEMVEALRNGHNLDDARDRLIIVQLLERFIEYRQYVWDIHAVRRPKGC